jgi:tetratricopeptide (TPR) repeat protein
MNPNIGTLLNKLIKLFPIFLLLSGCAAALVPYTSDPYKKISNSCYLINSGRPIPARTFLIEVMEDIDFENKKLLAEAYRGIGFLLSSPEYQDRRLKVSHYNTKYDGDYTRAIKYYNFAVKLFEENKDYYNASHTSYLLYKIYYKNGPNYRACEWLNECLKYNLIGVKNDSEKGANVNYNKKKYSSFVDEISALKKMSRCD